MPIIAEVRGYAHHSTYRSGVHETYLDFVKVLLYSRIGLCNSPKLPYNIDTTLPDYDSRLHTATYQSASSALMIINFITLIIHHACAQNIHIGQRDSLVWETMPGRPTCKCDDETHQNSSMMCSDREDEEVSDTIESSMGSLDSLLSEICDDPASTLIIPDATVGSCSPSPSPPPDGVEETDSGILHDQGVRL